jgi:CO/xanthine dehydrogenase Mo-binding subunit
VRCFRSCADVAHIHASSALRVRRSTPVIPQGRASPCKVNIAKGKQATTAYVADGLRFGTFYRAAGHLANPTKAIFEQSADSPTAAQKAGTFTPNCWVTIRRDATTVIESSHSEQGQGILTGIMSTIVDEADSDWDKVEIYEAGLSSEALPRCTGLQQARPQ